MVRGGRLVYTSNGVCGFESASKRSGERVQLRKAYRSFAAYIGGKAETFRRSFLSLPKDSPRARLALSWQRFGMVFGDEILSAEEIAELILMDEFDLAAPRGIR
jgi:hypothetical protein